MKRMVGRFVNRRGATIVVAALSTAAILAVGAISVDLAMLFKMRVDAQRTADAAALAGASAYLDQAAGLARDSAFDRAFRFVSANYIGGTEIDIGDPDTTNAGGNWTITSNEATVEFAPAIFRVRVTVRRPVAPTLFARILGINGTPIGAFAAAEATNASGARCVKPFALADTWEEGTDDLNANDFWDTGEQWTYDRRRLLRAVGRQTGRRAGRPDRNRVRQQPPERQRHLGPRLWPPDDHQAAEPQVDQMIHPGHFFAWEMPDDPIDSDPNCATGGGGGASAYKGSICECNDSEVYLNTEYDIKPGNMVGPTKDGIEYLNSLDPKAKWVSGPGGVGGSVTGSKWAEWRDSPRVIKVALFDPAEEVKSGRISIGFNNIALMFLEDYVRGRGRTRKTPWSPGSSPSPRLVRCGTGGPAGDDPPSGRVEETAKDIMTDRSIRAALISTDARFREQFRELVTGGSMA